MYSVQPNSADSATINPAALNSPGTLNYAVVAWWCAFSPSVCLSPLPAPPSTGHILHGGRPLRNHRRSEYHIAKATLRGAIALLPSSRIARGVVVLGPFSGHPWPHSPLARATTPLPGNRHWGRARHGSAEPTRLRTQLFHFPAWSPMRPERENASASFADSFYMKTLPNHQPEV